MAGGMKLYTGRGNKGPSPETAEKIAAIQVMRASGMTWAAIGAALGVSKQRAFRIANRMEDGRQNSADAQRAAQRRRYHRRHPEARYYKDSVA